MTHTSKIYLNCPYSEKDECKQLGARWDNESRKWYIPVGIDTEPFGADVEPFQKWMGISSSYEKKKIQQELTLR